MSCRKKRAIVAARDYDEFRHLVACANQKSVTRQEMESLGKPKLAAGLGSSSNVRYSSSRDKAVARAKAKAAAKNGRKRDVFPETAPKTSREFERAWRRQCTSLALRWRYLLMMNSTDVRAVFKVDVGDLGTLLKVLHDGWVAPVAATARPVGRVTAPTSGPRVAAVTALGSASMAATAVPAAAAVPADAAAAASAVASAPAPAPPSAISGLSSKAAAPGAGRRSGPEHNSEEDVAARILGLLGGFAGAGRFSLSVDFFSAAEHEIVAALFDRVENALGGGPDGEGRFDKATFMALRKKYCLCI